ncbi:MAG: hypothetical protein WB424_03215 [Terracidiphilus sp.]
MVTSKRNFSAAISLFFVAPFVAEYLLGDLPLKLLTALIVLAPAYGGGAVLIRETARRAGRGWPTMLVLGAAYALIGEGLVSQSLFNPDYMQKHWHLLHFAYIPVLGIGGWWTLLMLNLHAFWSMGLSIALVEALFPDQTKSPWMGLVGDSMVAVIFVLGSSANFYIGFKQNHFVASHAQLVGAAALSGLLIVCAFLIPERRPRMVGGRSPSPWITGSVALVFGMGIIYTPPKWDWAAVGAMLVIDAVFLVMVAIFSRQNGWSALHILSMAVGGTLVYGIHAFTARPLVGGLLWMRISNTVFLLCAVCLIGLCARRVLRYQSHIARLS